MVNNKVVLTAEHYLFGNISLPDGFHKELKNYMLEAYDKTKCVVLYKRLLAFQEFLSHYPELPDIGRKEFIVTRNGSLQFSHDYFSYPLEEVFLIRLISDEVVKEATNFLFGSPVFIVGFYESFKNFIRTNFKKSDKLILSTANKQFMDFLKRFPSLPNPKRKKLIIYSSGKMAFSEDALSCPLQEITYKMEEV